MNLYLLAALIILLYMVVIWLVSLAIADASIVDFLWGPGFVLVTWFGFLLQPTVQSRDWLVVVLGTLWGMRLAVHIFLRNRGQGEDYRYAQWRKEAGRQWWWRSFFKVNLLQGAVMWVVALPLIATLRVVSSLNIFDFIGVVMWVIGFGFEAVGDWQLARFKRQPENEGRVLDEGLWRYTRHPNYFGEALLWWGFYLLALAAGQWWTIISPLLLTFLLLRVSGVAMLEKNLQTTKPQYREYMQRTSAFFPRPPRE